MRQIQGKPTKAGWSVGLLSVIPLWLRHLPQRGRHPLSRKLDASPLPGRPRPVRRLEEADDHGRKPWYCRQKRAGRAHTKRHKADSSFSLKTGFVRFYKSIIHFLLHIVNNKKNYFRPCVYGWEISLSEIHSETAACPLNASGC